MNHQPLKSGRADGASYHGRQPGQQVDQLAGDASNKSAKTGGGRGWGRNADPGAALRCAAGAGGGGAAGQKGRPAGREARGEIGADDRKEGSMETTGERRAFYMWAKRRGGANPHRGKAKPQEAAHRNRDYSTNYMHLIDYRASPRAALLVLCVSAGLR